MVNVCTNISCLLQGGEELLHHAEERLGIKAGGTTEDGNYTLEDVECIAACTEAPCVQINYRYAGRLDNAKLDMILDKVEAGELDFGSHGKLSNIRQHIPPAKTVGVKPPTHTEPPEWFTRRNPEESEGDDAK